MKCRIGLRADLTTHLVTGRVAEDEGIAAIALHARTVEQHYAGAAEWDAIGELKAAVDIPVLGNGDIWEAGDALAMMAATGCDGVVVGRGCLGRPWLFGELAAAFAGEPTAAPPRLGEVAAVLREHGRLLVEHFGGDRGVVDLRKHVGWYLTGYPVGGEARRRLAQVSTLEELEAGIARPRSGRRRGARRGQDQARAHQRTDRRRPARWLPRRSRRRHATGGRRRPGPVRRVSHARLPHLCGAG